MTKIDQDRLVSDMRSVVANENHARDLVILFLDEIAHSQDDISKTELEVMEGIRQAECVDRPWAAAALACVLGVLRESSSIQLAKNVQGAQARYSEMQAEEHERSNNPVWRLFYDHVFPLIPDAYSKRIHRRKSSRGGPAKKKGPDDSVLCREVEALHARYPRLSWSTVCKRVGEKYDLSRQRIIERAKDADWRKPTL